MPIQHNSLIFTEAIVAVGSCCFVPACRLRCSILCSSYGTNILVCRYFDTKRVGSYGGVKALRRVSRVPVKTVKRWLSEQDAYTLHKPIRTTFKRRCVVVGGPHQQWQADLLDVSNLKKDNDEITFLLTVIGHHVCLGLSW